MSKPSSPSKEDMLKMLPALFLRMLPPSDPSAKVQVVSKKKTFVARYRKKNKET